MANLLSWSDQQTIKKMSANNEAKYAQIATEVEEEELRSLLGVAMLQDLQDNPTETNNARLLNGDSFENYLGQTVKFKGIKFILAYLNFAKYIGSSFVSDTFTGMVVKTRAESELVSEGTIKRLQLENRRIAMAEWDLTKEFLDLNSDDYPNWYLAVDRKKPHTPRIYGVRKTAKGNDRTQDEDFHFPVPRT